MNWGRAKTILIILFIVTDISLLLVLLQTKLLSSQVPENTVAAIIKVLQEHDIAIDSAIIPREHGNNQNIIMRNYFEEPKRAAANILGEIVLEKTESEVSIYEYVGTRGILRIGEDGFFYHRQNESKPYKTEERPDQDAMRNIVVGQLSVLGFDKSQMTILDGMWKDGLYYCKALPQYQGVTICGISMLITADLNGIADLQGNWFYAVGEEDYSREPLLDITSVLTQLIYWENRIPMEITEINNVYYVGKEYLNSREIVATPAYEIVSNVQQVFRFDARVGNQVQS
ncbi:MAG: hypothetical protein E7393_01140 [Ruminococcaceae bacterium]|nr:hypothetical protein [Oscillospiraceae bacterium]